MNKEALTGPEFVAVVNDSLEQEFTELVARHPEHADLVVRTVLGWACGFYERNGLGKAAEFAAHYQPAPRITEGADNSKGEN